MGDCVDKNAQNFAKISGALVIRAWQQPKHGDQHCSHAGKPPHSFIIT